MFMLLSLLIFQKIKNGNSSVLALLSDEQIWLVIFARVAFAELSNEQVCYYYCYCCCE
jgi:hypothetical protein